SLRSLAPEGKQDPFGEQSPMGILNALFDGPAALGEEALALGELLVGEHARCRLLLDMHPAKEAGGAATGEGAFPFNLADRGENALVEQRPLVAAPAGDALEGQQGRVICRILTATHGQANLPLRDKGPVPFPPAGLPPAGRRASAGSGAPLRLCPQAPAD